jgi:DNA invertase Pin-like site-specific DNA recombinase
MTAHLTPEERQHVLRRYQEGTPLRQIAREIERSDATVRRTLSSLGVVFGPPKTVNRRSSAETEDHVLQLYDRGVSWQQLMEQAHVTSTTVSKILKRNSRAFDRKPESAEAESEIITALYESGHSTRAIGEMLKHSKSTINGVVTRTGGKIRTPTDGCDRPDFFEVIDTPEKAYWLGFIAADGCMVTTAGHPEGSHLALQLALRDRGHLIKLKDTLQASAAIGTGVRTSFGKTTGYARFSVGSRRLADSLLALGITPRKSVTLDPWDGPNDLMPHYWRGMVDGDGSLAKKTDNLFTIFFCGSEACVIGFTAWAAGVCGTTARPYFKGGCWYISISGRHQVGRLVRALYADAPVSLDRKQAIADQITASPEHSSM